MTISEHPPALGKLEALYELLKTLKRKEICIEIEGRMYRGDLVYVGEPHISRKSFVTIKDVIHGNVRVPFRNIQQIWYHNQILWNYITQRPMFAKRFNKR